MVVQKNKSEYSPEHFRVPSLIPVAQCFIDTSYQRPPSKPRYTKIANEWDKSLATPITVSKRVARDGEVSYAVVDGGHRYEAANLRGLENIAAYVKTGLNVQQEAKLFHDMNNSRKATTPRDNFKASYTSGNPQAVRIVDIVTDAGFYVDNVPHYKGDVKPKRGFLVPVVVAVDIFNMDDGAGMVLKKTLTCLETAWGKRLHTAGSEPLNGALIVGLAHILAKASTEQYVRLENQLRDTTPKQIEAHIVTAGAVDQKRYFDGRKSEGEPVRPSNTHGVVARTSFRMALIDASNGTEVHKGQFRTQLRASSPAFMRYERFLPNK